MDGNSFIKKKNETKSERTYFYGIFIRICLVFPTVTTKSWRLGVGWEVAGDGDKRRQLAINGGRRQDHLLGLADLEHLVQEVSLSPVSHSRESATRLLVE